MIIRSAFKVVLYIYIFLSAYLIAFSIPDYDLWMMWQPSKLPSHVHGDVSAWSDRMWRQMRDVRSIGTWVLYILIHIYIYIYIYILAAPPLSLSLSRTHTHAHTPARTHTFTIIFVPCHFTF